MAHISDQTDLQTDALIVNQSTPSTKPALSLDKNQKKTLGISAAAMLLGGTAWVVAQKIAEKTDDGAGTDITQIGPESKPEGIEIPADVDVAGKVTDTMSFDQAFSTARDEVGMGGVFGWHGNWYNTFLKEEWAELSIAQRQEFTESVTQEHLPVKPYGQNASADPQVTTVEVEPTIIEGHLNGQRIMGLDFDQDGTIDTLVMEGADGYTYRVVDATGDDGLDTFFRYDSLSGELVEIEKIDQPFILTDDQFSQGLEESMSREVIDSILEPEIILPDAATPVPVPTDTVDSMDDHEPVYIADAHEPDDDTYINNGDVHDMDE